MNKTITNTKLSVSNYLLAFAAFLLFSIIGNSVKAQVVYNEGFEINNGYAATYPLPSLPMGWSQNKYCTTVGGYTAGTCFSTVAGWDRAGAASTFPTCSPRTGNTMLRFNSYYIYSGEKAYVATRKLDINTVGANSPVGSVWMYRDSGAVYNTNLDSISIFVSNSPSVNASMVNISNSNPRPCNATPATTCNGWYQINFTVPNAVIASWAATGMYIIIMGSSADGNNIYLDDFSIQEYPIAAVTYVASSAGLTYQNGATTAPNALNQLIVSGKMTVNGSGASATKLTINNFIFNTNGSDNPPTDITSAKLYWTGGTNAFDPSIAVLIGTVANPWATNYTFLTAAFGGGVDPNLWLQNGDNYFWITYDIAPGANPGDYVDAEWVSGQYTQSAVTSSLTFAANSQSLPGGRLIDLTYCIPQYFVGTSWAGYTNNDYVSCVFLDDFTGVTGINNNLNNISSPAGPNCPTAPATCPFQSHPPDYEYFPPSANGVPAAGKTAVLQAGNPYSLRVTCGTWFSSNYIAAWIDYNKNGNFINTLNTAGTLIGAGGGEKILQSPSLSNSGNVCTSSVGAYTQSFIIPADAAAGNTRLRVREVYATATIDPCASATYGETEDYTITIIPPCAPAWIGWKTWLGFTEDWNNPANWCGGVPTINDNARIPIAGTGPNDRPGIKSPKIKSGILAVAKNLRIEQDSLFVDAASPGSLTVAEDLSFVYPQSVFKITSDKKDTAQLMNGFIRSSTVSPAPTEPFGNVSKRRNIWLYTQSEILGEGILANDYIDTLLVHVKRNGTTTDPLKNLTIKVYYTDGTIPGFNFNSVSPGNNYRNMPNIIGPAPVTIFGPADVATSSFIPTTGNSGTLVFPLIANSFKWNGSTNKLVIDVTWDNTGFALPLGGNENANFTQTSLVNGYRHYIAIQETKSTSTYPAANFVVPVTLPAAGATYGAITGTAGTNTLASTYPNATFAVGQLVGGTGVSIAKTCAITAGNATITIALGTTGVAVGQYVAVGSGWAAGVLPVVTGVAATTITVSPAPTTTVASASLTFAPMITALSSAAPPYTAITLSAALPTGTITGNITFGTLNTTPTTGAEYRPNFTFKYRRPYGKFPIEVKRDWVNNGSFIPGVSQVTMTSNVTTNDSIGGVNPTTFYDLVINDAGHFKLYNDITVTDTLRFTSGRIKLNNRLLTFTDSLPGSLIFTGTSGIQSEQDVPGTDVAPYGRFLWKMGSATGVRTIPMVNSLGSVIPFTYNLRAGAANDVTFATYSTPANNLNAPQVTLPNIMSIAALNNAWINGAGIVDRYYMITNNAAGAMADITFRYAVTEQATYSNTNMMVERWNPTIVNNVTGSPNFGQVVGGWQFPNTTSFPQTFTPNAITISNYNQFSSGMWWTGVSQPAPLPVSLLSFTATPYHDKVRLDWTTASEINTSHFEIERTLNQTEFVNLGRVQSRGPSNSNLDYRMWDNSPVEGKQFYYLHQYDVDGKSEVFGPVSATFTKDVFDIINTTVTTGETGVNVIFSYNSDEPVSYRIMDMAGRIVVARNRVAATEGLNVIDIDAQLSKGAYQIILMNSEKVVSRKFFY